MSVKKSALHGLATRAGLLTTAREEDQSEQLRPVEIPDFSSPAPVISRRRAFDVCSGGEEGRAGSS